MQRKAQKMNTTTLNPRDSDGTKQVPPESYPFTAGGVLSSQRVAITQGRPRPRNTFTEFDPVTLPTDASAVDSQVAANIEAKVSGRDVPNATKVMAVTDGLIKRTHPNKSANSPMMKVVKPMKAKEITKHGNPPA